MQVLTLIPIWGWLIISALFYAGGEYFSKLFGLAPSPLLATLVIVADTISVALWLPAIYERDQLATTGTIWLLLGLAATVSIGLFVFHEHLTTQQLIGLVCAFVSVVLLASS